MTHTQEKTINEEFEKFLQSKKRYKCMRLQGKHSRGNIAYESFYADTYDTTGWIYYKPLIGKEARCYMFKGKPYKPLEWEPLKKGIHLKRRWQRLLLSIKHDWRHKADYKMRNRAEWHIATPFIIIVGLGIIVVGGWLVYKHFNQPEATEVVINSMMQQISHW